MIKNNLDFLRDEYGRNITVAELPDSIKHLRDNPYRTLASWIRRSNGYVKCGTKHTKNLPQCINTTAPFFLECFWAELLQKQFTFENYTEVFINSRNYY